MSMRDYSFSTHGIVLNGLLDADVLGELAEDGVVESQFSFTGDAFPLDDDGNEKWGEGESFADEAVYYVALPKSPRFFKAAYRDMDALVTDMLARYRKVRRGDGKRRLPVLTAKKVRKLLRAIDGTYFG